MNNTMYSEEVLYQSEKVQGIPAENQISLLKTRGIPRKSCISLSMISREKINSNFRESWEILSNFFSHSRKITL